MKKNLKALVEPILSDEAQLFLDMNRYEVIEAAGMIPDRRHCRSAHLSAGWKCGESPRVRIPLSDADLSGYRYMTFSAFSVGAAGTSFTLVLESGEESGYTVALPITKDGWNEYRIELPFMRALRTPDGWEHIGGIRFDATLGGAASLGGTLYFDSFFLYCTEAAPLYTRLPELKGAAAFSATGSYALVDRKRLPISIDGASVAPFEEGGELWLPMAPVAAVLGRGAVSDNLALSLNFTYRRKKYAFSADRFYTVDGQMEALPFTPKAKGGVLFFPADYVREFFRYRQMYVNPMGLILLSNRPHPFDGVRDEATIRMLIADMTLVRPTGERILADLHRRFPNPLRGRLLLSHDERVGLRKKAKSNETYKGLVQALKASHGARSEAFGAPAGSLPPTVASENMIAFSMLYALTGDKKFSERAAGEAEALAALSAWDEESLTAWSAVALGMAMTYDWCKHSWSEGRKARIERAMVRAGLRPAVEMYDGKRRMWSEGGPVGAAVNASALALALALCDLYPDTCERLLDRMPRSMEACFDAFAPDGGSAQGIGAWERSTRACVLAVAMLERACGQDYGFADLPGFAKAGFFPLIAETPCGSWNYHDNAERGMATDTLFFFAAKLGNTALYKHHLKELTDGKKAVTPLDLLFYAPVDKPERPPVEDRICRNAGLALLQSKKKGNAFGLHGGKNNLPHADLDAGSVLLEMGGVRFFSETGGVEALPLMTRRRAEGQNTYAVDPQTEPAPDQDPNACTSFTRFTAGRGDAIAVLDMTAASHDAMRATRAIRLCEDKETALLQDELRLAEPKTVEFYLWTRAEVELKGKSARAAILTLDGKRLGCRLGGAAGAAFVLDTFEGTDYKRLRVRLEDRERVRLTLTCRLLAKEERTVPAAGETVPISKW